MLIALVLGPPIAEAVQKDNERLSKKVDGPLSNSLDTYWMRQRTRMTLHDARQNPSRTERSYSLTQVALS